MIRAFPFLEVSTHVPTYFIRWKKRSRRSAPRTVHLRYFFTGLFCCAYGAPAFTSYSLIYYCLAGKIIYGFYGFVLPVGAATGPRDWSLFGLKLPPPEPPIEPISESVILEASINAEESSACPDVVAEMVPFICPSTLSSRNRQKARIVSIPALNSWYE